MSRHLTRAALAMAVSFGFAATVQAEDFYQGKTVNFVIGYPVGGGYDTYSRLIASHLGEHLAGHPTVVPLNMPGAVTIRATNYLYNEAPHDGTVIGMIDQAIALNQVLGTAQLRADATRFSWIGRIVGNSAVLYAWHLAPVKTIQDTFSRELIVAAGGVSSRLNWQALNNVVGTKLKLISGYPGTGEERIAMERGEIEAVSQPWPIIKTELAQWLKDRKINLLVQTGADKNPDLPGVPRVIDLAKNDNDAALLALFSTPSTIGRAVVAPPGLPAERVEELRRAFMETLHDPTFLREAERAKLDLEPLSGDALQAAVANASKFSPELIARAQRIAETKN
ncbi:MAG TPA: tripartite tricarboxylate transporter substrate-binding protein [Xanthobacteraceae bacterium]|nr:tripartite tricarboxylate transporter substrate-binding protein [Xanthobacteraceae bacterium]